MYEKENCIHSVVFDCLYCNLFDYCFAIPDMRIKLEAEPIEIFFKSNHPYGVFKTMISLVVAIIFGAIPLFFGKKK